jgi:glutamine synthetase
MDTPLREFLEIPYSQLEEMNLQAKADRVAARDPGTIREARMKYLTDEKRIKALTVCFTDLEGRFHMLDYDKKFLLKSADNLTFDGSSIRGFSRQAESDLRLAIDWPAFYMLPADVFGPGKVLVFGEVCDQDGTPYAADIRARLKAFAAELRKKDLVAHVANEIEGFIFKGRDAERRYFETGQFEYVSTGGYYHSLPGDTLRKFIDTSAEVQRALGFAVAVRDELRLHRGHGRGRPGAALQADRAPGGGADGPLRELPAQAGGERERQRLPHQHVDRQAGPEPVLRQEGG